MNTVYFTTMETPIGKIVLTADGDALTGLFLSGRPDTVAVQNDTLPLFLEAKRQLEEYFAGTRQTFDLPLAPVGTEFQRRVWQELTRIPFGLTISYGELASRLGDPKAARAVGLANGRNPISIIVPCHRVIGANGNLTGYSGGLERKHQLLDREREHLSRG